MPGTIYNSTASRTRTASSSARLFENGVDKPKGEVVVITDAVSVHKQHGHRAFAHDTVNVLLRE